MKTDSKNTDRHQTIRLFIWAVVIAAIGLIGYFGTRHGDMFRAELTQVGEVSPAQESNLFYIPNNYTASAGEEDTISIMVGGAGYSEKVKGVQAEFEYNSAKIIFGQNRAVLLDGTSLVGKNVTETITDLTGNYKKLTVVIAGENAVGLTKSLPVFKLRLTVASDIIKDEMLSVKDGASLILTKEDGTGDNRSIAAGEIIKVILRECVEADWECPEFNESNCINGIETRICGKTLTDLADICDTANDPEPPGLTRACSCTLTDWDCDPAGNDFDPCLNGQQTRACNKTTLCMDRLDIAPETYRSCGMLGLVLTLDETTVRNIYYRDESDIQRKEAFSSVAVLINSISAEGREIQIEGQTFILDADDGAEEDVDIIKSMSDNLAIAINNNANTEIRAESNTPLPGASVAMPGVVYIAPTPDDKNGMVDIEPVTQIGMVSVIPLMGKGLTLQAHDEVFGLQAIGKFDNGSATLMNVQDVSWKSEPLNRLNNSALNSGRLEAEDAVSGPSSVFVEIASQIKTIKSNSFTVTVPSGPVISYANILNTGDIKRGSIIDLLVKASDINTLDDIQEVRTWIAKTDKNDFQAIASDTGVQWITQNVFIKKGEIKSVSAPSGDPDAGSGKYGFFEFPVQVPDINLIEGSDYRLILVMIDKDGNEAYTVKPISIGASGKGDVDGDGKITVSDVWLALRINTGSYKAGDRMLKEANADGKGDVTMTDVILIYQKCKTAGNCK